VKPSSSFFIVNRHTRAPPPVVTSIKTKSRMLTRKQPLLQLIPLPMLLSNLLRTWHLYLQNNIGSGFIVRPKHATTHKSSDRNTIYMEEEETGRGKCTQVYIYINIYITLNPGTLTIAHVSVIAAVPHPSVYFSFELKLARSTLLRTGLGLTVWTLLVTPSIYTLLLSGIPSKCKCVWGVTSYERIIPV
jgi:hypothetical protein